MNDSLPQGIHPVVVHIKAESWLRRAAITDAAYKRFIRFINHPIVNYDQLRSKGESISKVK